MASVKDTKQLLKSLKKQGFTVAEDRKHYVVTHPEVPGVQVSIPKTPSEWRSFANTISQLRRSFPELFVWKGR